MFHAGLCTAPAAPDVWRDGEWVGAFLGLLAETTPMHLDAEVAQCIAGARVGYRGLAGPGKDVSD